MPIAKDEQVLKNNCPHIVVGTPGRILGKKLLKRRRNPMGIRTTVFIVCLFVTANQSRFKKQISLRAQIGFSDNSDIIFVIPLRYIKLCLTLQKNGHLHSIIMSVRHEFAHNEIIYFITESEHFPSFSVK